jgi:hypothetical protein
VKGEITSTSWKAFQDTCHEHKHSIPLPFVASSGVMCILTDWDVLAVDSSICGYGAKGKKITSEVKVQKEGSVAALPTSRSLS